MDESHLWAALRYVELNPVRAGMVATPELWRWSSAAAHCGLTNPDPLLELERWRKRWKAAEWREFIGEGGIGSQREPIAALQRTPDDHWAVRISWQRLRN